MSDLSKMTMTVFEAKECVHKINSNLNNTRSLLLDLYEREGWAALGYGSWRACVVGEFKQHQSYLYRQLEAAKIKKHVIQNSPIGEIPESQLRPLASLPPEQQKELWNEAVERAPEGKVTAGHVKKVAANFKNGGTIPTNVMSDTMTFAAMAISQLERIRSASMP
jgi:hypothetical protein